MSEERPIPTGRGFFSRVYSGDDRREGRRMITVRFHILLSTPITRCNLRGRSPP